MAKVSSRAVPPGSSASAVRTTRPAASTAWPHLSAGRVIILPTAQRRRGAFDQRKGFLQTFAGEGYILQQFNVVIEMDQKCLVFVRAQYLFQESARRLALGRQHVALAQARIDQQSYNQG